MSEKAKNENKNKFVLGKLGFFLLWVVLIMAIAALNSTQGISKLLEALGLNLSSNQEISLRYILATNLIHGFVKASLEKFVLHLKTRKWIKGWISAGLLSTALGTMPFILLHQFNQESMYFVEPQRTFVLFISMFLPALPYVWVLRRYVKNAWVYVPASMLASVLANSIAEYGMRMEVSLGVFAVGAAASVMAFVLLWLFQQPLEHEKAKVDAAAARLEDGLREEDEDEGIETVERKRKDRVKFLQMFLDRKWNYAATLVFNFFAAGRL